MDTSYFKELLVNEKDLLQKELASLGRKNPDRKGDWEATEENSGDPAEEGEVAENLSDFDDNRNKLDQLEPRLTEVVAAIERIESGTFGICEACEAKIEEDRLEANPAATTCKAHMG